MFARRLFPSIPALVAAALVVSAVAGYWLFGIRTEPSALLLRTYTDKFAEAVAVETDHYAPSVDISVRRDRNYGSVTPETSFDIYRPASAIGEALPTVIWLHGGGWIAGSKADVSPYARKLASARFTVVTLNYPLSPAHVFPEATTAVNHAIAYLLDRAALYGIDPERIILAGNGSGANLASQIAGIVTKPSYAAKLGIEPSLRPEQLRGVVLAGGLYDVAATASLSGIPAWATSVQLRAYTGSDRPLDDPDAERISTTDAVSAAFPPTWITGADADPLTENQAIPFAAALMRAGVPVSSLFPEPGTGLPAEYQFLLGLPEAKKAFASLVDFVAALTG